MPQAIDLPATYRGMILPLLAEHVPAAEVWAFGSRVRGDAHAMSDLDLVLRNPEAIEQPLPGRADLIEALRDSLIPITVEVHDWALLPPAFREEIERTHAVLVEAGPR